MTLLDMFEQYVVDLIIRHGGLLQRMDVKKAMLQLEGRVDEARIPLYHEMLRTIRIRKGIYGKRGGWHYQFI